MKGKKGCKSKGGVMAAAHERKSGGRVGKAEGGGTSKPGHITTGSVNTVGATVGSPLSGAAKGGRKK